MAVPAAISPSANSGVAVSVTAASGYYAPPLRAAIVGTGGVSRVHGWRLQDLGSTVVGACGRDRAKARLLADEFGGYGNSRVGAFEDLRVMRDQTAPDVLHVCSPHGL